MHKEHGTAEEGIVPHETVENESGAQPLALKQLYDDIYGATDGSDNQCRVSTGSLAKARTRIREVLKGFGLHSNCGEMRVLDIGCGLGFSSEAFRELGASVTGIDLSSIAIDRAKEKFKSVDFRCTAFPDGLTDRNTFDLIYAVDLPIVGVFATVPIQSEFLQPCLRLLKPGGHIVIGWHTNFSGRLIHGWMHWSFRTIYELRRIFRSSAPLVPQVRFFWSSALACHVCRLLRYSAPVYFLVRAIDWDPLSSETTMTSIV